MVGVHVKLLALVGIAGLARCKHHVQKLVNAAIYELLCDFPSFQRLQKLLGAVTAGCGHFQVRTGTDALGKVVVCAPVGHNEAGEAPVVTKNMLQKMFILIGIDAVDHIVGRHDGLGIRFLHRDFKAGEVDLTQRPLIHD